MNDIDKKDNQSASGFSLALISPQQWMGTGFLFILIGIIYGPTLAWMFQRWGARESYYSHGYLVPLVTLWLLWTNREDLYAFIRRRQAEKKVPGSIIGLLLILLAIFLHILSGYFRVYFTSGFSILLLLFGISIYLFGSGIFRKTWFAIGFMAFMVPLPLLVIAGLNLRLKLFATHYALSLINLTGILAVQDGSRILFENDSVTVGNACSGLRSIISLLALGALYAYIFKGKTKFEKDRFRNGIKQILLFFSSIPIAMAANILRIFLIGVIAYFYGSELATGTIHDFSGYLLFAVAFGFLYLMGRLLDLIIRT